jgi:hypothetical protein
MRPNFGRSDGAGPILKAAVRSGAPWRLLLGWQAIAVRFALHDKTGIEMNIIPY